MCARPGVGALLAIVHYQVNMCVCLHMCVCVCVCSGRWCVTVCDVRRPRAALVTHTGGTTLGRDTQRLSLRPRAEEHLRGGTLRSTVFTGDPHSLTRHPPHSGHTSHSLTSSAPPQVFKLQCPAGQTARRMSLLEDPKSAEGRGEDRCRLVVCSFCGYVTDRKNNLKRHIQTMHEASSVELECCGQRFFNKADMRTHTRALHREGYMCPICRHVFCRKALLKRHLSVHTGIKEFICCLCGYDTSHKSNLERHMRTHAKDKEENKSSKKEAALLQAPRPSLPPQQAMRRAPPPARGTPKALHELHSKAVSVCDSQWASVWALQHGYQLSPPSLSPPPPPLLRYPAEACLQPAKHPCVPSRSFTIEELLRNSAQQPPQPPQPPQPVQPPQLAGPSQGIQNAPRPDRSQPAVPHSCAASAKILRPTPIRPHAKDFLRRPPQSSIAYQGRLLAVVDVTPPAPSAFVPPPPPPPPPPRLSITPPLAFIPSCPQPSHLLHAHLPPLQCVANLYPPAGDPLGVPTLKETPSPESPERGSSPERVSSPEEHHHATGEEYMHKKLRFSRKLRQVEVEQLCSASQEMPRD
ncbi:zinc finger protein 628-like [Scylla paramamosain]|uniref:zinc finger protein 628-like n=1 Tax=Scylla paramamosain TaxID=85552 RepID=UPI003083AC5E